MGKLRKANKEYRATARRARAIAIGDLKMARTSARLLIPMLTAAIAAERASWAANDEVYDGTQWAADAANVELWESIGGLISGIQSDTAEFRDKHTRKSNRLADARNDARVTARGTVARLRAWAEESERAHKQARIEYGTADGDDTRAAAITALIARYEALNAELETLSHADYEAERERAIRRHLAGVRQEHRSLSMRMKGEPKADKRTRARRKAQSALIDKARLLNSGKGFGDETDTDYSAIADN